MHVLLDAVPKHRRAELVSHYLGGTTDRAAADHLRDLGFPVAGTAETNGATTAWLDA